MIIASSNSALVFAWGTYIWPIFDDTVYNHNQFSAIYEAGLDPRTTSPDTADVLCRESTAGCYDCINLNNVLRAIK